jgi:two-component system, sensor histidine kinase and response regulator
MSTAMKSAGAPVEILIVEDSPTQAKRLQHILEQQGYHVTIAANGREALEAAQGRKPGLIISDVIMPEMDGYELCHRVKSDARLADIPVILVTTLSDPQDVIRGLECRADNFILKPYDERYLLGRVQFVLVNREVRQSEQTGMGVEIFFNGRKHFITADRLQILNLLLSTYEAAIQRNKELSVARDDLRRLNSDLEAANKELEAFSYSVSHDLRAPLRAVDGFSSVLLEEFSAEMPPEAKLLLDNVRTGAKQMNQLIVDLLRFSHVGRQPMSKHTVNLSTLVHEVLEDLRKKQAGRRIEIQISELPDCVGDLSLLRQVLVNLLSNAFKFTRQREQAMIEVGCRQQGGEQVYFVRDNGAGFDMRHVEKLFGVFQRFHRADEFEGTGVGLSIVQRIIQRHGGRIWAEAEVGKGATFYFTLSR